MKVISLKKDKKSTDYLLNLEFDKSEMKVFTEMFKKMTLNDYIQMAVENSLMRGLLKEEYSDLKPFCCLWGFRKELSLVYAKNKKEATSIVKKWLEKELKGKLSNKKILQWTKKHVVVSDQPLQKAKMTPACKAILGVK